jgi:iron complex outermembrane receptor protein
MNNFTKRRIAFAVATIGYVSAMVPAYAADDAVSTTPATSADASKLDRVEIVGSNIKRSNVSAQSTQIETYRTEDFAKKGATSAQDIVNSLASSQASIVGASSVGSDTAGASYANLRNLGAQYTLVLVDGRRVANQPGGTGGYAVDLNAIPVEAIERVDVLKDGASAIYGTDAIGGVINFITKKNYQGANATVSYSKPTSSGGGMEKSVAIGGGIGDLNNDGWNLQGTFGISKSEALMASGRNSTVSSNPQWSSNSPGNYIGFKSDSDGQLLNPNYPNCTGGGSVGYANGTGYCRENTSKYLSLEPEVSRWSATAKATKRVFDDSEFSLQYLHNETKTTATMAPTPMAGGVSLPNTSPYYPVGEPGYVDANGNTVVDLYGRTVDAGSRIQGYKTTMDRLQSNLEGTLAGWDYKAGIGYSESMGESTLKSGWINSSALQSALDDGSFNPFGSNSTNVWNSLSLTGLLNKSTMKMYTADYKMSREILPLPGGNMAVAFGSEIRREDLDSVVNTGLAKNAMSTGEEDSQSTKGGRTVYAFYGETLLPVMKGLEFNPAVRFDHYSDFGDTVNPKISFKATPVKQVMFRGSASTGFRAPTLYDMYSPMYTTYTGDSYSDPLGCPSGSGTSAACQATQQHLQYGGSTNLKPEKTFSTSIGTVITPVKSFMASADLWTTVIRNQIGVLPEAAVFGDPVKYANLLVPDANGNLAYAKTLTANLGDVRTSGVDLAASWRLPSSFLGNFVLSSNSTYTRFYQYQLEKGGAWINNLGVNSNNTVVFRWKTNTTLDWSRGDWSATLGANYLSGYTDANPKNQGHVVPSLLLWNGSVSYNWNKQATFTLGARNLFDKQPLFSNQTHTFQTGYDPRYSDIYGRTIFLTMSYKM